MASSLLLVLTPEKTPAKYKNHWKPIVEDQETKSFSYHLPYSSATDSPSFASAEQLDSWFRALHPSSFQQEKEEAWSDAYYNGELLLRNTAWVVLDPQCTCEYGYSDTWQPITKSQSMRQVVQEMTQVVKDCTGATSLNSCNLNYYPQGGGVGFHADDEFLFDGRRRNTCIISLSLAGSRRQQHAKEDLNYPSDYGARKFLLKPQSNVSEDEAQDEYETVSHEVILRHGDLLTMEGMFQNHYFHSVWPGDSKQHRDHPLTQGERINLTWRTIVQHLDGSKEECRGIKCPLSASSQRPES